MKKMGFDSSVKTLALFGSTEISSGAFFNCSSLKSMEFGGTVAQWKAVKKYSDWKEHIPSKCVKCADGEIKW